MVLTTSRGPAARTSACASSGTSDGTWPTSPRAASPGCCTRSRRTTSRTTATRCGRSSTASHDAGLTVQASPWGVGRTFGGEAESRWVTFHPEECQVLDDGRRVAGACLNSAAYRAFCKEWADWVLDCGVDSVFWDEPAWMVPAHVGIDDPARWTCRCAHCAERFGGPVPGELTPEVQAFREASVVDFLREVVAHVAARGGENTICLLPSTERQPRDLRLEPRCRAAGADDVRNRPLLEALERIGRAVRAPLRALAARDVRAARGAVAALAAELRPDRARRSPSSRPQSSRHERKGSTTCGRGATRPAGT